jgi:Transposase DDE domain group 1
MPDRRDRDRIRHAMFEMVMARASAIASGHKDTIDLDRLRHDPLMKVAVGRCPEPGAPLASQSTISRLENAPSKTEAAQLAAALLDQFGTTVKPGEREICSNRSAVAWGAPLIRWSDDGGIVLAARPIASFSCVRRVPAAEETVRQWS